MRTIPIVTSLFLTACVETPSYYYSPEAANAVRDRLPTHVERIPQEAPQGTVEIASAGLTKGPHGEHALHVRMTVDNEGDATPWTLDIRDQQVELQGEGRAEPQSANAGVQSLPELAIAQRERRAVDLYFPVPPRMDSEHELAGFDVLWQVRTPERVVAGRTHVDRVERENTETAVPIYASVWAPFWWYDPWYPYVGFHSVLVVRPHRR